MSAHEPEHEPEREPDREPEAGTPPERRQVRVRRSPKIGVFLAIGAVVGALVAIVVGAAAPQDSTTPKEQAIGYLLLVLAPVGAIIAGTVALLLDRVADRRAKTVDAEWIGTSTPSSESADADADAAGSGPAPGTAAEQPDRP